MSRLLLVPALLLLIANCAESADTKPNVLFICVDDLKPVLGCYGDPIARTPNVDRLAARGVIFERAYCNQAVCSPSRNSLLTSLRPQTLGIYDLPTNFRKSAPDAVTLPQLFKQQGYHTQVLGKIFHVGHGNTDDQASWSVPHFRSGSSYASPENKKSSSSSKKAAAYEAADVADNAYADGLVADEAVTRLNALKGQLESPFFMAVGFVKPHLPFCAPQKYWDLYQRKDFNLAAFQEPPAGAPSYAPQFGGELRNYSGIPSQGILPEDLQRTLVHGYYAAMSYMDAQVGKVLDALEASGHAGNTIIVFWGDHGWHLGDHGIWCKHTNYEQAARIPVIVSLPGTQQGVTSKALIETVDIYPTLCELTGIAVPEKLDGRSFASTVRDSQIPHRDHAIHVYPRGDKLGRAIRTERYRLVEWKQPGAAPETADLELYDYQADPLETRNLAPEQPSVVADLRKLLDSHPEARPSIAATTVAATTTKPKQDRGAMFARRDKNKDGQLDRAEFLADQPDPDDAPARFIRFDVNQDGVLSKEEFVSGGKTTAK